MTTIEDLQKDSNRKNPVSGRDMPLHTANPHTNVDEVHGGNADNGQAEVHIEQELVDYVAEHTVGGSMQDVELVPTGFEFVDLDDPANSSALWGGVTGINPWTTDDPSTIYSFTKNTETARPAVRAYFDTPVVITKLRAVGPSTGPLMRVSLFQDEGSNPSVHGQHSEWITTGWADDTNAVFIEFARDEEYDPGNLEGIGYSGEFERMYLFKTELVGATIVPASCTDFIRFIDDGVITGDYKTIDGTPYTVVGVPLTYCPIPATAEPCDCENEFTGLQNTLNNILAALQNPTTPPAATLVEAGQPVLTLSGGVSGATYTRDEIAHYGLNPSLIQASGYSSFVSTPPQPSYLLNSVSFVPSDTFTLSVSGGTPTTHDYTFVLEGNSTPYQFEEVDDFSITVPANQTVILHMTVGLYPTVTP